MAAAEKKKDIRDEDDENEEKKEPEKKGSPLKLIIIIVVVVVLLAGGGLGAYFFLSRPKAQSEEPAVQKESSKFVVFWPMDPFIVNLADTESERYLKVVMQLELSDQLLVDEMKKVNPKLRDAILELLSSKAYKDVMDPAGKQRLRDEIVMRMNMTVDSPKGKVLKVYFTEFVVQ